MGIRADRKKMAKKFKVGDIVTWGSGASDSEVVEISADGVYVKDAWANKHFVAFVPPQNSSSPSSWPLTLVRR